MIEPMICVPREWVETYAGWANDRALYKHEAEVRDFLDKPTEPAVYEQGVPVSLVVPEGWKLVPVEPTEYMMKIARGLTLQQEQTPSAEYRAMVKAAPNKGTQP